MSKVNLQTKGCMYEKKINYLVLLNETVCFEVQKGKMIEELKERHKSLGEKTF